MDTFRVLVTGTREDGLYLHQFVSTVLTSLIHDDRTPPHRRVIIVHGDCPQGVDQYAKMWAVRARIQQEPHPADWKKYGKRAGPIRNGQMVATRPDYCIGFPASGSRGTWDCLQKAVDAGIPTEVHVVGPQLLQP